eukprot:scaffold305814_cov30-Tisochrysis_lutea.AAC.4
MARNNLFHALLRLPRPNDARRMGWRHRFGVSPWSSHRFRGARIRRSCSASRQSGRILRALNHKACRFDWRVECRAGEHRHRPRSRPLQRFRIAADVIRVPRVRVIGAAVCGPFRLQFDPPLAAATAPPAGRAVGRKRVAAAERGSIVEPPQCGRPPSCSPPRPLRRRERAPPRRAAWRERGGSGTRTLHHTRPLRLLAACSGQRRCAAASSGPRLPPPFPNLDPFIPPPLLLLHRSTAGKRQRGRVEEKERRREEEREGEDKREGE